MLITMKASSAWPNIPKPIMMLSCHWYPPVYLAAKEAESICNINTDVKSTKAADKISKMISILKMSFVPSITKKIGPKMVKARWLITNSAFLGSVINSCFRLNEKFLSIFKS